MVAARVKDFQDIQPHLMWIGAETRDFSLCLSQEGKNTGCVIGCSKTKEKDRFETLLQYSQSL